MNSLDDRGLQICSQAKLEATAEFPEPVFGYGDPSGDMRLKKAMVNLLHSTFLHVRPMYVLSFQKSEK